MTRHGGHLGFIGQPGIDPDRRWMDWRTIEWLLE
jgi:predicted alpha/beta-fold hydrolase